jgi:ribosomal protein L9
MKLADDVSRLGEKSDAYKFYVSKPYGENFLGDV